MKFEMPNTDEDVNLTFDADDVMCGLNIYIDNIKVAYFSWRGYFELRRFCECKATTLRDKGVGLITRDGWWYIEVKYDSDIKPEEVDDAI